MAHYVWGTQYTTKNIGTLDTMVHTDIVEAISKLALDQLITSRDMSHEDWAHLILKQLTKQSWYFLFT